jgi:hypothetical protein
MFRARFDPLRVEAVEIARVERVQDAAARWRKRQLLPVILTHQSGIQSREDRYSARTERRN